MRRNDCFCRSFPLDPECDEHALAWHTGAIAHHDDCPTRATDSELVERCRGFLGSGQQGRALWWAEASESPLALHYVQEHLDAAGHGQRSEMLILGAFAEQCEHYGLDQHSDIHFRFDHVAGDALWVVAGADIEAESPETPTPAEAWDVAGEIIDTLMGVFDHDEPNCYIPGYGWTVV